MVIHCVADPAAATATPEKSVRVHFHLINCNFNHDLSHLSQEAGNMVNLHWIVGGNSTYWKLCEEQLNNGFPVNLVDGPTFADKVHFNHPIIDGYLE